MEMVDEALVRRARAGDDAAFRQLVCRYEDRIFNLGLRICGRREEAEEVVQETFLQVFRRLGTFRGRAKFSTWLYQVATNAALMHRRRQMRTERRTTSLSEYLPAFNAAGRHARIDVDYAAMTRIESQIERRELSRLVLQALARMPARYRAAVVLGDLQGLSGAEAAAALRVDQRAFRQRLHRGRLMLRGFLGSLAGERTPGKGRR